MFQISIQQIRNLTAVALLAAGLTALLLAPVGVSRAAPPALPPCGDDTVSGSTNSGAPDIGQSANGQYTAVVWAEGSSGNGTIKLAYSEALTQSTWQLGPTNGVVRSGSNTSPRLDFSTTISDRVHIVYRSFTNNGLGYARCTLGGTCDVTDPLPDTSSSSSQPQIAATATGVVIVYEESGSIRLLHFADSGAPTVLNHGVISSGSNNDQPAIAYSNGKIHVVFLTNINNGIGTLDYLQFNDTNVGVSASLGAPSSPTTGVESDLNAARPSIAALGDTVMIVWDSVGSPLTGAPEFSEFRIHQNFSRDNGATWNGQARSIPAHIVIGDPTDSAINDDLWVSYDNDAANSFPRFLGLQPDVALSEYSGQVYAHVVWHAQMYESYQEILLPGPIPGDPPDRGNFGDTDDSDAGHDILYAVAQLGATGSPPADPGWSGIPMGNDGTLESGDADPNGRVDITVAYSSTHGITDLTAWYFADSYIKADEANDPNTPNNGSGRDTIKPRIVFLGNSYPFSAGEHFNRLQVVYLSQDNQNPAIYEVRYNGYEIAKDSFSTNPSADVLDSDCDSHSDQEEIQRPADDGDPDLFCDSGTLNGFSEMNCDYPNNPNLTSPSRGDYVPDFMDTDADGDGILDISDTDWRVSFLGCGGAGSNCVFLPVVIKNR
ncbi:MAG: hypothetical protein Kow0031_29460 [Anaerolineae bacterium]